MSYNLGQNFDFSPSNIFNNNNLIKSNPPSNPINKQFQGDKDPLNRI